MIGPNIAAALVAAQAEIPTITKDAKNPHFNSKFASLDGIIAALRPILAKHQLALTQSGEPMEGGKLLVHSTLVHSSGESIVASVPVTLVKQDPQGAGAAMTYGRRFSLSALLCIATDEDDDGNAASRPPAAKREPKPEGEQRSRPTNRVVEAPVPSDGKATQSTTPAKATATVSAADQALGETPAARLKLNGRFISLMLSDELNTLIAEKGENPTYAKHVAAAKEVLASRTDDARVARIKQEEEAAQSDLKFAGST